MNIGVSKKEVEHTVCLQDSLIKMLKVFSDFMSETHKNLQSFRCQYKYPLISGLFSSLDNFHEDYDNKSTLTKIKVCISLLNVKMSIFCCFLN